jgi:hypothetical protein
MTFAFPAMLWGTLAAFIPLLIHLFDRRRPRPHPFGAISFVLRSQKRTAARLKLRRLIIYALRTVILCAIPLALAKPELTRNQMAVVAHQKVAATVVVLDSSLSMRWADGDSLFEVGKGLAKSAISGLAHEEPASVLVCGPKTVVLAPLSFDRKTMLATLDEATPSFGPADLNTCLELAATTLADSPMLGRRIVLVSDFTVGSLKFERPLPTFKGPQGEVLRPDIVLRDAGGGRKELPNHAVIDIRAEPATQMGPRAYQFTAVVKNFSDTPRKDVELALRIDGKTVGKGFVDLSAQGTAQKVLSHRFEVGGTFTVEVALPADALVEDDRRSTVVQVPRELKALLVNGSPSPQKYRDEAFFVDAALASAGSPVRPVLRDTEAAWAEDFNGYDVVMLLNVAAPPEAIAAKLKAFVEGGGGLWVSMGDNVDPDMWNGRLGTLLPRQLRVVKTSVEPQAADARTRAAKLSQMSLTHPLFAPFAGKAREGLLSSRFYRYMLLEGDSGPTTATGEVLASLDDGAPALTASRPGKGRVLLFTSTVDRDWSDFAIRTSFLPLIQRMGAWLAGALDERDDLKTLVGNSLTLKAESQSEPATAKSPSGHELKIEQQPDKTWRVGPLEEPGTYSVIGATGQPQPSLAFSVVLDAAESELSRFKAEELSEYFGEDAVRLGSGDSAAPKTPLWTWLILGAVVAFLFEGVLLRK